ncbi:amidohydrolase [Albidovulum sediminicola]|uniref:Amidohydrolase n=1 Tax=Albidovulum sediminicola TaxID=2984331 RepID=A0ABT2Z4I8_9RHOB|nr:amidohydrolase [Defluviimonas sp. WL0075]MCV2865912.1 amidohydrolase [Defluviimonas sp. WL0075]
MTQADIIIENARILTMDPAHPRAEAIAISGKTILALGSNTDIAALAGPRTRRVDACGRTVLPGLVEGHMHLFGGAFGLRYLQLGGVKTLDALRSKLHRYAAENPNATLLICKATDYSLLVSTEAYPRQMLDEVLSERPVLCFASDHHTAWANTIALQRAGLLHGREMPEGHEVMMGPDGTATGELRELSAIDPVMALRNSGGREVLGMFGIEPEVAPTDAQREDDMRVMKEGLAYCASFGFTSLHNMDGNRYQLDLLHTLEERGELICRIQVPFHLTPEKSLSTLEDASWMHENYQSELLRSGRVKMFMDGVVDSGTAVLVDEYSDAPGWRGGPLHSAERFSAAVTEADRRGLQMSVHAIGDGAVRRVLDGYEAARDANGARDSRHRIEHIELLHPDDLHRFKELGVVASMQPPHVPGAMDFPFDPWRAKVGEARWPHAFPVRALANAGVPIVFASDWPVSDINPMRGVMAAMTRQRWTEACPDNRLSLEEALYGYTAGGAYAAFDETRLGRLKPGMQADIVVMDHDLEALEVNEIGKTRAALTLCAGAITWEA